MYYRYYCRINNIHMHVQIRLRIVGMFGNIHKFHKAQPCELARMSENTHRNLHACMYVDICICTFCVYVGRYMHMYLLFAAWAPSTRLTTTQIQTIAIIPWMISSAYVPRKSLCVYMHAFMCVCMYVYMYVLWYVCVPKIA